MTVITTLQRLVILKSRYNWPCSKVISQCTIIEHFRSVYKKNLSDTNDIMVCPKMLTTLTPDTQVSAVQETSILPLHAGPCREDTSVSCELSLRYAQMKAAVHSVTARVWCRGRIDRKRNSTINLTTDSGACYLCLPQISPLTPDVTTNNFFTVQRGTPKYI